MSFFERFKGFKDFLDRKSPESDGSALGLNDKSREAEQKAAFEQTNEDGELDNKVVVEAPTASGLTGRPERTVVDKTEADRMRRIAEAKATLEAAPEAQQVAKGPEQELTQEQKEKIGQAELDKAIEETFDAAKQEAGLTGQQKKLLDNEEFKQAVKEEVASKPTFGQKLRARMVDFGLGAGAGIIVRKAMNVLAPGWGVAAGAAAGGISGAVRGYRQEGRRVEEVQKYLDSMKDKEPVEKVQEYLQLEQKLENKKLTPEERAELRQQLETVATFIKENEWKETKGIDRLKQVISLRESASNDAFKHDKEAKKVLKELNQSYFAQKDKKKIIASALRGAAYGGAGAYIGGLVVSWFEHSGDAVVRVGEHAKDVREYWAGLKTAAAEKITDTRDMHGSVWNTVKEFFHEHGIQNPSNDLLNRATRVISGINNVEITGDHATAAAEALHHHVAAGVHDIAMRPNYPLHGFEELHSFLGDSSGSLDQHIMELAHPGAIDLVMRESHPSLEDLEKILLALGIAGAADAAVALYEKQRKGQDISKELLLTDKVPGTRKAKEVIRIAKPEKEQSVEAIKEWKNKAEAKIAELLAVIAAAGPAMAGQPDFNSRYGKLSESIMGQWNEFKQTVPAEHPQNPAFKVFLAEQNAVLVKALHDVLKYEHAEPSPEKQLEQKVNSKADELVAYIKQRRQEIVNEPNVGELDAQLSEEVMGKWNEFQATLPANVQGSMVVHEGTAKIVKALHGVFEQGEERTKKNKVKKPSGAQVDDTEDLSYNVYHENRTMGDDDGLSPEEPALVKKKISDKSKADDTEDLSYNVYHENRNTGDDGSIPEEPEKGGSSTPKVESERELAKKKGLNPDKWKHVGDLLGKNFLLDKARDMHDKLDKYFENPNNTEGLREVFEAIYSKNSGGSEPAEGLRTLLGEIKKVKPELKLQIAVIENTVRKNHKLKARVVK